MSIIHSNTVAKSLCMLKSDSASFNERFSELVITSDRWSILQNWVHLILTATAGAVCERMLND